MLLQGTAEEGRAEEKHLLQREQAEQTQVSLEEAPCSLHCSSSQLARDSFDQARVFKYYHEDSPPITARMEKIKQKKPESKPTEARKQP